MGLKCYIINTDIATQNDGINLVTTAKVYANITDDSGQPANGNGAVITYSIKENGVITDDETPAYGQSVLLFDGIIEQARNDDNDNYIPYYSKSFGFVVLKPAVDTGPPVNYCDLVIDRVNVDKPESAPGAGDAQITVQASSSYLPLQYSLDNINFQTSNTFTGITGGLKTIYVKDANAIGCAASVSVTVAVMGRLLVSDPSVNINGNISRWNAAFNPVVFTYQRKDFEVIAVSTDSITGNAKLLVNADLTSIVTGDLVYINAGSYNGVYQVNATTGAGNTIIINTPYTTTADGFININRLRPYYKLLTKITYQDLSGVQTNIRSNNRPDNSGLIKADISNFLQSLVQAKDESDYTKPNFRDANLSASYQVAYAEHWDDGTTNGHTSDWVNIADPYYVIYAAKQLGQRYGGNLAGYVPFINGEPQANWITDFAEPAYSNNYPFDIGFIYSEQMGGLQLYSKTQLLDINRNQLPGDAQDSYLLNDNGSWLLNQDGSKLLIARQAVSNSPIIRQLGLNRLLINTDFADDVYYFVIGLYHNGSAPATFNYQLTEATFPTFIDGNGQLKDNNVEVADIYSSGFGSHSVSAGNAYSFEAFVNETSAAANPTIRFTITKDGTVIFDKRVAAILGTSIIKRGVAQPGATYDVTITTVDTTETITPIDIADDTPFTGAEVQVVKDQVIRIDKTIDDNSVYLRWIGLTGSWNYYRFVYNQEISLDVQNATIIKNFVSDWENQQGIEEVISKTAGQKMKVMAQDLSVADIKGLQSIKYSPKVQILVNKNPVKWQTVVLNTATFSEYETINGQAPFSVTFNLPSINIQTQ
ncbi:MAG: hypothetical protein JWR50_3472 [Mucilaginibacter sp.]|nr:hypothetical protein [Mucilaginibacter sp.]